MANPYVAEVRMFGGNFAPSGWAFCNGQLMPIAQNTALFSLIGTTYGGDGQNTFALPNLQGRFPMHWGTGAANASGLTTTFGQSGGSSITVLNTANLPSHTHSLVGSAGPATLSDPTNANLSSPLRNAAPLYTSAAANATLAGGAVTGGGSGTTFGRAQPYCVVNFIISLFGVFPSRN